MFCNGKLSAKINVESMCSLCYSYACRPNYSLESISIAHLYKFFFPTLTESSAATFKLRLLGVSNCGDWNVSMHICVQFM